MTDDTAHFEVEAKLLWQDGGPELWVQIAEADSTDEPQTLIGPPQDFRDLAQQLIELAEEAERRPAA